ncbi:hypothetical protein [uncultured Aquimarina sp.]|jgi:hypothetical protein|uniref:hypothetical protein n=1 Tax=uncultured Aquimarina sp. TaxID=575652 RepID=UPI002639E7FB|nr:hypothetical protein [uncultured Aquimarina sp.]
MIKFTECLNDTWDYFFLTDPANLLQFKKDNDLSDDLMSEFTSNASAELAIQKGIMIPMSSIKNQPYTVFFNTNNKASVLKEDTSLLVLEKTGYILEIINNEVCLVTVPYLKNWTKKGGIDLLKKAVNTGVRQKVQLENGCYAVTILGGFTLKNEIEEATFEFQINPISNAIQSDVVDIGFPFLIEK